MTLYVLSDPLAVAQKGASFFKEQYEVAVQDRGRFIVGLSGGSTPLLMYRELLLDAEIDWRKVWVTFTDDRFVPLDDPQSNERAARDGLLNHVRIPATQIINLVRTENPDLSAKLVETDLKKEFGEEPVLDLAFLGLGEDGHTASLFPGDPSVHVYDHDIVVSHAPVNAPIRITMTPPILNRARRTVFLVTGVGKADAAWRCLEGPANVDETPSQAIARFAWRAEMAIDEAAASRLNH